MVIEGYKAFRYGGDGKLFSIQNNYEFKVGETYEEKVAMMCVQGFHYCPNVLDVFEYYPTDSVVCKVTDLSDDSPVMGKKSCTTKLRIDERLNGKSCGNNGLVVYFKNGILHRDDDLPAIEYADGSRVWFREGKRHRDGDLPAVENSSGTKEWFQEDERHRDGDLPAVENSSGKKEWWKKGKRHRDGESPAIEYKNEHANNKEWWKRGKQHRDGDLPAIEYTNEYLNRKEWWKEGKLHRDNDLPAIEHNGVKEWIKEGLRHHDGDLPAVEDPHGIKLITTRES